MNLEEIKYKGNIPFYVSLWSYKLYRFLRYDRKNDAQYLKEMFRKWQGYPLNIDNPSSLNEKIQWLKIHDRRPINSVLADKYAVRDYIKNEFGEEFLIPLLFHTDKAEEIEPKNLPEVPFIIKVNHDSGNYLIVRDKKVVDWKKTRTDFKWWLSLNYYPYNREWQYKNIRSRVLVEKLLLNNEGKIPNDYKLHCINGKVAFVYVSVDGEG